MASCSLRFLHVRMIMRFVLFVGQKLYLQQNKNIVFTRVQ